MLSKEHKYTCKVGLISDVIFNLVQSSKKWTKSLPSTFQSRIKSVGTIIRTISLRNTRPNWKYRLKLSHLYISQVAKSKPYAWKLKNSTHIMVHKKVWRYVSWESIICERYCKTILTDLIECGEHVFQTWHWWKLSSY